jgi:RHS repeat-associated protein
LRRAPNAAGTPLYSYDLTGGYDPVGNVVGYTDSVTGSWTNTYDSLNRLATATAGATGTFNGANVSGKVQAWTYDAFGNRTTQTASNGAPFPTEWANYATTGNNHISTSNTGPNTGNVTYDLDGRLLSDGDRSYLWEAQGWLCGITAPGPAYYQYIYDAEGRRITSVTRANANCDLGYQSVWQDFVLDKDGNQVTEISGAGAWKHTNVYADGELLATYDPNGVHFAFGDWQGTKRAQASATGTLEVTCDNLPFNDGFACQGPGGSDATEHHYTGKEHDPYTGLDLFGARNFTNYSGRFLSPDTGADASLGVPVPYAELEYPQSLNLYSYVNNNPLTNTDPDGHDVHVCVDNGNGGQNCFNATDDQWKQIQQNSPGVQFNLNNFGSGSISCGGSVCGSAQYFEPGLQDESGGMLAGIAGGMAADFVVGRAVSAVGSMLGRGAGEVAGEAAAQTGARTLISGSKQAIKAGIKDLGLPPAQEANVLRAASRAGNDASITVKGLSDGSVQVTTSVPGRAGGFANYTKVIGPDGVTQPGSVVQEAFDRSGTSVHYDPKY